MSPVAPGSGATTVLNQNAISSIMSTSVIRIGIFGCGLAADIHLDRLLALDGVEICGCADADLEAARALANRAIAQGRAGRAHAECSRVLRPS